MLDANINNKKNKNKKMSNLWKNLKKYAPTAVGVLTLDSWVTGRKDSYRDRYLEAAYKKGLQEQQASKEAAINSEHAATMLKNKITITSDNLDAANTEVNKYSTEVTRITNQMLSGNLTPEELAALKPHLEYVQCMQTKALQNQTQYTKELQDLSISNDPDILKSDFSEIFNNFVDTYREFLSILSSEQKVILLNLCGYIFLIMIMTSITTLLIGGELINYFQLESKYPKLAKYIKFQLTLRKYSLRFYIVEFYFSILILISVNIFMFSYSYFYFS